MISFKQNIATFPTEKQAVLSKAEGKSENVVMACFPLHQKAVKAKLFFCSFPIDEMPQRQNCEQRGSESHSEAAACPVRRPGITAGSRLFFTATWQERCSHIIDFFFV